jgi:hypothetical protein
LVRLDVTRGIVVLASGFVLAFLAITLAHLFLLPVSDPRVRGGTVGRGGEGGIVHVHVDVGADSEGRLALTLTITPTGWRINPRVRVDSPLQARALLSRGSLDYRLEVALRRAGAESLD